MLPGQRAGGCGQMTLWYRWNRFREVPEAFPGLTLPGPLRNQLLWDGECGFCAAMVNRLQRFAHAPFQARPFQEVQNVLPNEVLRWCPRQMHWIAADGRVFGGALALSAVLASSGHPFLSVLLNSPPVRSLAWLGYRLVAGHRSALGAVIGGGCALPKSKSPQTPE
jgi:predicted DCC family thiol-disulfide oxidoreductase YuxK